MHNATVYSLRTLKPDARAAVHSATTARCHANAGCCANIDCLSTPHGPIYSLRTLKPDACAAVHMAVRSATAVACCNANAGRSASATRHTTVKTAFCACV